MESWEAFNARLKANRKKNIAECQDEELREELIAQDKAWDNTEKLSKLIGGNLPDKEIFKKNLNRY